MTRSIWYLGLETLVVIFAPLYFLIIHPSYLQWRVPVMAAGLLYVAILARRHVWGWETLGLKRRLLRADWLTWGSILAGVGLVIAMMAFPHLLTISEFITEAQGFSPLVSLLVYVFVSAPLQELLFRGFYIARLRLVSNNPYFVILYSSLIFGLVHAPFANKALGLSTTLAGVVWSYYVYKHRSLYPVIFSHALLGGIIMGMTLLR